LGIRGRGTNDEGMYQRPCSVQLSIGPTAGLESQNCVCRSCPPGEMKQQLASVLLLWQLKGPSLGQLEALAKGVIAVSDPNSECVL
jgi:hypothetical protein